MTFREWLIASGADDRRASVRADMHCAWNAAWDAAQAAERERVLGVLREMREKTETTYAELCFDEAIRRIERG